MAPHSVDLSWKGLPVKCAGACPCGGSSCDGGVWMLTLLLLSLCDLGSLGGSVGSLVIPRRGVAGIDPPIANAAPAA